jgi:vacuolar protein sorting-associated protein 3
MQLATTCVDQLLACVADTSVSKLWRAKGTSYLTLLTICRLLMVCLSLASSYASSRSEGSGSFLSYFAATTPNSDHKRVRLKTILFLQGSTQYDPAPIRQRLLEHRKILQLELAIIDGKVKSPFCDAIFLILSERYRVFCGRDLVG